TISNKHIFYKMSNENSPTSAQPVDVSKLQDGGVTKIILKEGVGENQPTNGSKVTVHYTGKLLDGTVFDSSHNHGQKFTFNLGKGEVIKAWDCGVASMKRGEVCELTCKPEYAYGSSGSPPKIPPNSTLIFEVELFDWEGEDLTSDKGVIREVLKTGDEDYMTPNDGALVEVLILGKYNDTVFDNRTAKYNVGEGDDLTPPAVDIAVKKMKKNEHCRITVAPQYGFGAEGCSALSVPPYAHLVYELTLLSFEKSKEAWECTDERLEQSEIAKEKGTSFVKQQNYKRAITQYKKISTLLEHHDAKEDGSEEDKELIGRWKKMKLAGYLNIALCQNKEKLHLDAIHSCEEAIKLDVNNEKAYYRMGEAMYGQHDYNDAKAKFAKVLEINPNNKLAKQFIQRCDIEIKKIKQKEMKTFRGMFDKFAQEDEKEKARAKAAKKSA
uniref:peptidylprolyl isomerase n=1 Tax=Ciona intestinalis TaxID=7719 RepID=F6YR71_CIOIN